MIVKLKSGLDPNSCDDNDSQSGAKIDSDNADDLAYDDAVNEIG